MKNIHVLPTDKSTGIFKTNSGLQYSIMNKVRVNPSNGYHIYITSDEEVKVGDWVIEFQKGDNIGEVHFINGEYIIANDIQKKIIITTDQDLERVQSIDDEFLEWFVNNPNCEEVGVDKNWNYPLDKSWEYKIIIPKEEQKELRRKLFTLIKSLEEEPKQDPLEEAAKEYAEMHLDVSSTLGKYLVKAVFLDGAQCQSKRMYSEQDMAESFVACWKANVPEGIECKLSFKEWFEQFKKK